MAIEIVDFPMKNGGSFHGKMLVHQRVYLSVVPESMGDLPHPQNWGKIMIDPWMKKDLVVSRG